MDDISNESVEYIYNLLTGQMDPIYGKGALAEGASRMHDLFDALIEGGFNESQAIQIIVGFLMAKTIN